MGRKIAPVTVALVAMLVATTVSTGCWRAEKSPRVLVFGIDGATWGVIDEMMAAGELPTIKKLHERGLHGILESRPPALSPVVWSTIFTGFSWKVHGVQDWKTSQSTHRKVKAVWEIASELGLKTYVLNVPSTWPPETVSGGLMSGFPLSGSTIGGNTGDVVTLASFEHPDLAPQYKYNAEPIKKVLAKLEVGQWSEWFDVGVRGRPKWTARMRAFCIEADRFYLTPIYRTDNELVISYPQELRGEIEKATDDAYVPEGPGWSKYAEEDTPKYLYEHLLQISQIQTRAAIELASRPWDLFLYVNTLVDRVSHPYWAYMRPADYDGLDAQKAAPYADAVKNAYRETDIQLAHVLEAAGGDPYVVIVSDHGFHSNLNKSQYIGTHDFDGVYLVSGPNLPPTKGGRAYIEDVAPTVLYLLEQQAAQDMEGKVIPELVDLIGRPVEMRPSYEEGADRGSDVPVDAKTWEQLRGLGYVDGAAPRKKEPAPKQVPEKAN